MEPGRAFFDVGPGHGTLAELAADLSPADVKYFNEQIKGLRHFEDTATEEFARLDPEFRDMWEASDRTHTALIIREEVGRRVVDHSSAFDVMYTDFTERDALNQAHDLAKHQAQRLRDDAVAQFGRELAEDFWRGGNAVWQRGLDALHSSQRSAARLRARLERRNRSNTASARNA